MFYTQLTIPPTSFQLMHQDQIFALGSCFAENIGEKLRKAYFSIEINPFGVLYNPCSIANSVELILQNKVFVDDDIFEYNSLFQSFLFSSLYADVSSDECLHKLNESMQKASKAMQASKVLLLTFGTHWVYEEKESGRVVANCHKLPATHFLRRRLSVDEIVDQYTALLQKLHRQFPLLTIVFTVSPIRHWKDGAHENTLSKSTLHLAVDQLQQLFDWVEYFPAYEIQMDELRDYRFYASDMLHPSELAVDYIWEKFAAHYFSDSTQALVKRLVELSADLSHRPFHPQSISYQHFLKSIETKKRKLCEEFPFLCDRI